jgi:hypothetical protein
LGILAQSLSLGRKKERKKERSFSEAIQTSQKSLRASSLSFYLSLSDYSIFLL